MTAYTVPLISRTPDQSAAHAIAAGEPVTLQRELGDRQSIRVLNVDGIELGYVHRQSAKWIADRLDSGKFLEARIAPLVTVSDEAHSRRVQLSVYTEPHFDEKRPWWKRLFPS